VALPRQQSQPKVQPQRLWDFRLVRPFQNKPISSAVSTRSRTLSPAVAVSDLVGWIGLHVLFVDRPRIDAAHHADDIICVNSRTPPGNLISHLQDHILLCDQAGGHLTEARPKIGIDHTFVLDYGSWLQFHARVLFEPRISKLVE
jgi:hypothetical protein